MLEALQNRGNTLVVVGAFAPAMFHPSWFARYELLGNREITVAAEATNLLVSNEISLFKIGGFDIDIRPNRMQIGTSQESLFKANRDLVCSMLEVIDGISVEQIGINWTGHFATQTGTAWHAAGDKLVPKTFWKSIWPKHVGMSNLSLEFERKDERKGSINLAFQPSSVVTNGVFLAINDHFDLKIADKVTYSTEVSAFLQTHWSESKEMAEKMFDDVWLEISNA